MVLMLIDITLGVYRVVAMLLPVLILLLGLITTIKNKGFNRLIGISLCLAGLILLIIMIVSIEGYGFLPLPGILIIIGATLILTGAINSNEVLKKKNIIPKSKTYVAFLIIIGIIFVSSYPLYEITNKIYKHTYPVTGAVLEGNIEELKTVLNNDADPNELLGEMPLAKRVLLTKKMRHSETYEILQLLLDNGYNLNETDKDGITILMYTTLDVRYGIEPYDEYDLPSRLTELFVSYGADVNAKDNNDRTALMWACNYRGHLTSHDINTPVITYSFEYETKTVPVFYYEQIKCLIDNGSDVNAQDKNGNRALDYFRFAMEENSKNQGGRAIELYNSQEYLESCRMIEELLQYE